MKKSIVRFGFFVLFFGLMVATDGFAQSMQDNIRYKCGRPPFGTYGQLTSASYDLSEEFFGLSFTKESDLRENRWTLDALDEVDPTYKFLLLRDDSASANEKCSDTIVVAGKLVSPIGKLFEFKQATYSFTPRRLIFTTVERDGIVYEGAIQFFPKPVLVSGIFQVGTAKLKASGRALGTVTLEFTITVAGSS